MHKYDLRVLGGKKRLLFPLFYLSEPNKSNYIKAFSPQNTRFVVGSWYLTWFVKFSFITGLERKYVCIKLPFFTSIHTAEVLEEDETCTMHSGFWHAFHISRSLVLTCASGVLFPWPEVTSCIEFWKCFRAHWWRRKSVLRTLTSPSAFPAIPPPQPELCCSWIQGTDGHYPHHPHLLPHLYTICSQRAVFFLGPVYL